MTGDRSIRLERASRRLGGPGLPGFALVALLVVAALGLYLAGADNIGSRGTWFVVGEISGIAAATLLPIAVILAARVRPLEWLFGDLTRVYVSHAVVGLLMFALVSVHPLLYVVGTLPSGPREAAHVIVPFHLVALDWISYLLIATAMVTTLYLRLSFSTWRFTHMLLGLAMMLTGYSVLVDNQAFDTFQIPALRILLLILYGVATAAFFWVAVISRILDPKREYEIVDVIHHETAGAVEMRARPTGRPLDFVAGQFAGVDLLDDRLQTARDFEAHPFSIVTAPGDDELGLVIQSRGPYTQRVREVAVADRAHLLIHSPFGRLSMERPAGRRQIWIGGGIGITPFMSQASELARDVDRYGDYDVTLVHVVDQPEHSFCAGRLRACAEQHPGLSFELWSTADRGRPTADALAELVVDDVSEVEVMLCGPEPMITDLEAQFRAAGVPRGQIRWERAIGPPSSWRAAAPTLRRLRLAATGGFALFAILVIASIVGRALT